MTEQTRNQLCPPQEQKLVTRLNLKKNGYFLPEKRIKLVALTLNDLILINRVSEEKIGTQRLSTGHSLSDIMEIVNDVERPTIAFNKAVKIKIEKINNVQENLYNWYTYWLIIEKKTNLPLGFIGFKGLVDGVSEVGYGIHSGFEGKGYMSEALSEIVGWAFSTGLCKRITAAGVLNGNVGSQKVLEKIGFKEVKKHDDVIDYEITI